ncbi:MAG: S-adenosylmethionine decarboxylase [Cyanobacteria bacterium P01_H01_bin.74]
MDETASPYRYRSEFGPHLMMDCQECDLEKISSLSYVYEFINNLPDQIGMTKITQPYVFPYEGIVPEDKGITASVIIAESHLTFHSFTEKDYFFFDLFSCKPFDVDAVKRLVIDSFSVRKADTFVQHRGLDFPRSVISQPKTNPAVLNIDTTRRSSVLTGTSF